MEAKPCGLLWGRALNGTAGQFRKRCWSLCWKDMAIWCMCDKHEHNWAFFFSIKFSGGDFVLDCSPSTCRICSFTQVRIVRQSFCILWLKKPVNSSPGLPAGGKKIPDLIHQLDRKCSVQNYFYSTKFLKTSIVSLLFGTLNDHNCNAQPAFVPGGKDLVPQNYLYLLSNLQPLPATPLRPPCCQAGLGPETRSSVIQHLTNTLEHEIWLPAFRYTEEVVSLVTR